MFGSSLTPTPNPFRPPAAVSKPIGYDDLKAVQDEQAAVRKRMSDLRIELNLLESKYNLLQQKQELHALEKVVKQKREEVEKLAAADTQE
jgi:hypothetical protein